MRTADLHAITGLRQSNSIDILYLSGQWCVSANIYQLAKKSLMAESVSSLI